MHPETEPKPSLRAIAEAFFEGCIMPSRTAFWAMLVGLSANLALAGWFFRYETLGTSTGAYLAGSYKDVYAIATHRALAIAREETDAPLLLVLGSSATSTALAFEGDVKAAVDRATGKDWEVAFLTTGAQGPIEQLSLLDTVLASKTNQEREIVILLGVEASIGYWSRETIIKVCSKVRLGLRSDWADAAWTKIDVTPEPRSRFYFIENSDFVAVNGATAMLRLLIRQPVTPRYDHYAPPAPLPASERLKGRERIGEETREGQEINDGAYLGLLQDLGKHLAAYPNVHLIIAPERPSPELVRTEKVGDILAFDTARYADLARDLGAEFWPMMGEGKIPQSAYYDELHIGDPAVRAKIIAELAARLAASPKGDSQS